MARIGFDGFEWEEIKFAPTKRGGRADHIYIDKSNGKTYYVYIQTGFLESAGIPVDGKCKLYSQGTAIYMLKAQEKGEVEIKKLTGRFCKIGNSELAKKLMAAAMKFEVIEAQDGYVLFRPIREN